MGLATHLHTKSDCKVTTLFLFLQVDNELFPIFFLLLQKEHLLL